MGLRECMIVDDDGYVWVPGVAIPGGLGRLKPHGLAAIRKGR